MGNPDAVTVQKIISYGSGSPVGGGTTNLSNAYSPLNSFRDWLMDRKNRRRIPSVFSRGGYVPVRNPNAVDGRWKIEGEQTMAYVKSTLDPRGRLQAAQALASGSVVVPMRGPRGPARP